MIFNCSLGGLENTIPRTAPGEPGFQYLWMSPAANPLGYTGTGLQRRALGFSLALHGAALLWLLERQPQAAPRVSREFVRLETAPVRPARKQPQWLPLPLREASGTKPNRGGSAAGKAPEWTWRKPQLLEPVSTEAPAAAGVSGEGAGVPGGGGAGDEAGGALVSHFEFEGEEAQLTPPMSVRVHESASGGYFIMSPLGSGSAVFPVNVTVAGQYVIWCRVLSPRGTADSFYVSVDGGPEDIYDTAEGTWSASWQWTRVSRRAEDNPLLVLPRVFPLLPGAHVIRFRAREAYTCLDKCIVTRNVGFDPR